jgi:hypothetical protein
LTDSPSPAGMPEWTEYRTKNGLDPLGMQSSSVSLYQALLPGISNVTLRIRYYGLYAWLSREYARTVGDTDPVVWQRFIRRAEALYALIAHKHGGENGVAGINWAGRRRGAAGAGDLDFAADADPGGATPYLKQAWGAYGAAYASQLFEIGVFAQAKEHQIPVPSPEIGDSIAAAFESAMGPVGKLFLATAAKGSVSNKGLAELAPLVPSGIAVEGAERDCYEKLLFARSGSPRAADQERRRSLLLILSLTERLGHVPSRDEIRWALYSQVDAAGPIPHWPTDELERHRQRWWVYQANDLTHICYEALLKFTLDQLESYAAGVPLATLLAQVVLSLKTAASGWSGSWASFRQGCAPQNTQVEEALCGQVLKGARTDTICSAEAALDALKLLAIVHSRVRTASTIREELKALDPTFFHSVLTESTFLEANATTEMTDFVLKLLEERIIRRHLWVAMRKLRFQSDYTFLIEADDGKVRLRVKDGPVFTNPRLGPALTFLQDIHLLGETGLSDQGKQVLASA